MSSIVDSVRDEAWKQRWNLTMLGISWSLETRDTDWRRSSTASTSAWALASWRLAELTSVAIRLTNAEYAASAVPPRSPPTASAMSLANGVAGFAEVTSALGPETATEIVPASLPVV